MDESMETSCSLSTFIRQNVSNSHHQQLKRGAFPRSGGGVYDVQETPVRNTAKWLIANLYCLRETNQSSFCHSSRAAVDYLLSEEPRPHNITFQARDSPTNRCDGLVGQAEPIKSLALASEILGKESALKIALEVFSHHPFDENLGLWEAVEVDGTRLSYDRTLNHQIIFASAAAELADECEQAEERVVQFLDRLGDNIATRSTGLVRHYIRPPGLKALTVVIRDPRHWPLLWNEFAARYHAHSEERRRKELGYHSTVLASLATLKRKFPSHEVWDHSQIQAAISFTETEAYRDQVKNQASEYGSMLPGFNHAKIIHAFRDADPEELRPWIQLDIDRTYDPETGLLTRNAVDPVFQASSICTATELPNVEIQVPDERNNES